MHFIRDQSPVPLPLQRFLLALCNQSFVLWKIESLSVSTVPWPEVNQSYKPSAPLDLWQRTALLGGTHGVLVGQWVGAAAHRGREQAVGPSVFRRRPPFPSRCELRIASLSFLLALNFLCTVFAGCFAAARFAFFFAYKLIVSRVIRLAWR